MKYTEEYLNENITVCGRCIKASCLQGISMCGESQTCVPIQKTRKFLIGIDYEHPKYMLTDDQLLGNSK